MEYEEAIAAAYGPDDDDFDKYAEEEDMIDFEDEGETGRLRSILCSCTCLDDVTTGKTCCLTRNV